MAGLSSLGVPGVPWHTQILADQLTLSQPRGTDYAHHSTACPSDLKTYLHLCICNRKIHILFFQPRQNPTELSLPPVDSTSCNFMENRGQIAWLFWVVCNIWEERRAGQTMIDILTQTVVWRYEIHLCFDPQNGLKKFWRRIQIYYQISSHIINIDKCLVNFDQPFQKVSFRTDN